MEAGIRIDRAPQSLDRPQLFRASRYDIACCFCSRVTIRGEGIFDGIKWPNVDVTRTWVDDGRGMREAGRGEYPPTAGSPPHETGLPCNVLLKEAYYGLDQVLVLRKSRIDVRHSLQAPPAT